MKDLTYFAIFEPASDGGYSIYFPDLPGCTSWGDTFADGVNQATEAAHIHVYGLEGDGDLVPQPSLDLSKNETKGNIVVPITIHPELFRRKKDNERVKTNTTIPLWLKRMAEKEHVNYSRLLESALMDYLKISVP